jgi:hypothetical protein
MRKLWTLKFSKKNRINAFLLNITSKKIDYLPIACSESRQFKCKAGGLQGVPNILQA